MELMVIRPGENQANVERDYFCALDAALNDKGHRPGAANVLSDRRVDEVERDK